LVNVIAVPNESTAPQSSDRQETYDQEPFDDKAHIRDELDLTNVEWRQPNPESENTGTGVEFAFAPHTDGLTYVAIRQSSQPDGDILIFTPTEWIAFTEGVKDNEFDWD